MYDNCNLSPASTSSFFLYLVFDVVYQENPDSHRQVAANGSSFLMFRIYATVSFPKYELVKITETAHKGPSF